MKHRVSREVLPLASMDMICVSKPGNRRRYHAISFGSKLSSRSLGIRKSSLDVSVGIVFFEKAIATVRLASRRLAFEMILQLGVQRALGQRFVQIEAVLGEGILWITPCQKLIQRVLLDCHMPSLDVFMAPSTKKHDSPRGREAGRNSAGSIRFSTTRNQISLGESKKYLSCSRGKDRCASPQSPISPKAPQPAIVAQVTRNSSSDSRYRDPSAVSTVADPTEMIQQQMQTVLDETLIQSEGSTSMPLEADNYTRRHPDYSNAYLTKLPWSPQLPHCGGAVVCL